MTLGSSPNWFPKTVQTQELGKENKAFIWPFNALDLDLLDVGCLLDVLGGMLLHQPPLLQKDFTSNSKGLLR